MKDVLELLRSSEEQLTEIEQKVQAIDVAALSHELQKKRDSFLKKSEVARKAILAKKIEFFKILFSLRSLIPMECQRNHFGPYSKANTFTYIFLEHGVGYLKTYRNGESSNKYPLPDQFVTDNELAFYEICTDMIERIKECTTDIIRGREEEQTLLIDLRERLTELTLSPV